MHRRLSFIHERGVWEQGSEAIGIDEVGRGALAGPVFAGAVCFPASLSNQDRRYLQSLGIYDSKHVTSRRRAELDSCIRQVAWVGVGSSDVVTINARGIVPATNQAMAAAMTEILPRIPADIPLIGFIDAFMIPNLPRLPPDSQRPIIRGDSKVLSIAAASIVAKVARDRYMELLGTQVPGYGFDRHKGYGTAVHRSAIRKNGPCEHHRELFIRKIIKAL